MNRVLIVDDDESILFALRRVVTRRGWEPLSARSGSEALKYVDRADAVVTDLCMPVMSGLELIKAIRERDEMLPVILVTAQEHFAAHARRAGAYDYLTTSTWTPWRWRSTGRSRRDAYASRTACSGTSTRPAENPLVQGSSDSPAVPSGWLHRRLQILPSRA